MQEVSICVFVCACLLSVNVYVNILEKKGYQTMSHNTTNVEPEYKDEGQILKPSTTEHPLYGKIVDACKTVYDPEIPVNIYDLGLIYTGK